MARIWESNLNKLYLILVYVLLSGTALLILNVNERVFAEDAQLQDYERPDVENIRSETRIILEDPVFVPRMTLKQWFLKQFEKLLSSRKFKSSEGLGRALMWILAGWGILAVIAIIGHLIWTIVMLVRNMSLGRGRMGTLSYGVLASKKYSYEELCKLMEQFAGQGEFNRAIAFMMLALLRWLDKRGVLAFDESKTNGDYVEEFVPVRAGDNSFKSFVLNFDATIYGGVRCDEKNFVHMKALSEQVRQYVNEVK